jgi:hypothetical protein
LNFFLAGFGGVGLVSLTVSSADGTTALRPLFGELEFGLKRDSTKASAFSGVLFNGEDVNFELIASDAVCFWTSGTPTIGTGTGSDGGGAGVTVAESDFTFVLGIAGIISDIIINSI